MLSHAQTQLKTPTPCKRKIHSEATTKATVRKSW